MINESMELFETILDLTNLYKDLIDHDNTNKHLI